MICLLSPGLGSTAWDAAAAGDNDRNFYLWGAMGGAAMIGFGLALAQPKKRVAVITGDGEMLMGLGALATIGIQKPRNLAVIVFDNGVYSKRRICAGFWMPSIASARPISISPWPHDRDA